MELEARNVHSPHTVRATECGAGARGLPTVLFTASLAVCKEEAMTVGWIATRRRVFAHTPHCERSRQYMIHKNGGIWTGLGRIHGHGAHRDSGRRLRNVGGVGPTPRRCQQYLTISNFWCADPRATTQIEDLQLIACWKQGNRASVAVTVAMAETVAMGVAIAISDTLRSA